ncbi:hypothetical protein PCHDK_000544000 [Plasmodium chabaudi adami]|uniref:Uncharacterized protein n=1 Tax=Plasmodium chabaudi adami TaxID=5826 RepID=A0A1D3LAB3_PLACE|nr:hypothetical protein PCHDK_000544000 [Plasmodium chabaudi adami]
MDYLKGEEKSNKPLSTQNIGSKNSKQVKTSDAVHVEQSQSSGDFRSKISNLEIGSENPRTNVEEKTPQLVRFIDIPKGYNRPEIVITVL